MSQQADLTYENSRRRHVKILKRLSLSQSHYREVGDFYGTGIEIWAGFGPVQQLLRPGFSCFHGQKRVFKNILDGENIFGIE